MKSEIIEKEKELKFPCLMVGKDTGNVYLMESEECGTCVFTESTSPRKIAEHSQALNSTALIPFEGKIILQND